MREKRFLLCSSLAVAAMAAYAQAQISAGGPFVLSAAPAPGGFGTATPGGGQTVEVEFFVTNSGAGQLGVRGGQFDPQCSLPGGSSGTIIALAGLAGGTTDPDGDSLRGPSRGGVAYLFGSGGLGPYAPATCIIANTPGVGAPPAQVPAGATRYIGTILYQTSQCAAGAFDVVLQNINTPPTAVDTTRYRDDGAGMGLLIQLQYTPIQLTVPVGTCCDGVTCLADGLNAECCAATIPGGSFGQPNTLCSDPNPCACTQDDQCNDGSACTNDSCDESTGTCVFAPIVCNDGNVCTDDSCNPASGCVFDAAGANGDPCGSGADTACDNPDTCLGGSCVSNFEPAGTSCNGGLDQGECDNPDTCDGAGACQANNKVGACTDDGNQCTDDVCAGGNCTHPNDNTNACSDGADCTSGDACSNGTCVGTPTVCDECFFCDEVAGGCVDVATTACVSDAECAARVPGAVCVSNLCACNPCIGKPNGEVCDDGDACTLNDACYQEECVGGNALCAPDGNLCTTDCVDGACVYQPTGGDCSPEITFDPKGGGENECFAEGSSVVVDVNLGSTDLCVAGGEFRLVYDPSCLDFVGVVGDGVWPTLIYVNANEATGVLVFAVGAAVDQNPSTPKCGTSGSMARITFTKVGKCSDCDICPVDLNPAHNRLTGPKGELINFPLVCSDIIHDDRPSDMNCPFQDTEGSGIAVNADCDGTTASVSWDPVVVVDQCDGAIPLGCTCTYTPILHCQGPGNKVGDVCQNGREGDECSFCIGVAPNEICYDGTCQAKWDASEVDCMDYVNSGGNMPQGRYEYNCADAKSPDHACPDGGTCRWTVQVSDHQSISAHVQLSPIVVNNQFDRCICFELFSSCTPEVMEESCQTMHFGGPGQFAGQSTENVKVKKGKYVCITARDRQHSLRATDPNLSCDGTSYHADFSGDPFFGGNWLVQGNLNRDAIIDILDFGTFLGQLNQNPNPKLDKLCEDNNGKGYTHADLNGDGNVDVADFTFIQINFLDDDKNSCCPDHGASSPVVGLTEVSVKDLRTMGLGELVIADLNNDGMVNTEDMAAYLAGARPKEAGKGERGTNGRVGSLRK